MKDIEKYQTAKQVYVDGSIEMRGMQRDKVYTVHVFVDGNYKCNMSYQGGYNQEQVNAVCASLSNHIKK